MLFNSFEFLLFFPIVTLIFFVLGQKFRWLWLLAASCFFYMFFKPEYILILAFTIVVDYYMGIWIENEQGPGKRKAYLVMSLIANIGVLAVFKYYNFLNDNITELARIFHKQNLIPALRMVLPIGLSFHTFQAMSYTIEVYRGNQKAERHFGIYALYVMFFPQLVAGPIERPQNILYQFHEKKYFLYENALEGLKIIAFGFFKKLVIADRVGIYVNEVYSDPHNSPPLAVFAAVMLFAVQIYTDFSGYSDIARGTAKVLGYDLLVNFNYPFKSLSITEFWRRWHISLSTWFNDYLFTPLLISFRNLKKSGIALALLITFSISGLWHGAGWTFIIYGLMHGIAMVYEFLTKKFRKKLFSSLPAFILEPISMALVWLFVAFSWVFFRSENIQKAQSIFRRILDFPHHHALSDLYQKKGPFEFGTMLLTLVLYLILSRVNRKIKEEHSIYFISIVFILIMILGKNGQSEFIYFQF